LYELPALKEVESIPTLGTHVSVVAYSPDGTLMVSGSTNGWLRVWSCGERRLLQELPGHKGGVRRLRFSSDGTRLLSGDGRELICWDTRAWQRVRSLVVEKGWFVGISPDWRVVGSGEEEGKVSWRDTETGRLLAARFAHHNVVANAAFTADGTRAASVAHDGTVALWDVSSFQVITTFKGHMLGAHGVAFSPDGRRLATGGGNGREAVKLWDLSTQRELVTLAGQGMLFDFVAFSPDGNWLAASSTEGRLHLWRAPSGPDIDAAEKAEKKVP